MKTLGADTSLRTLIPYIQRASLLVIVEPDGQMATLAFRPGEDEDTIERVGHSVNIVYGHEPRRYIKRLTLKLDGPLEPSTGSQTKPKAESVTQDDSSERGGGG